MSRSSPPRRAITLIEVLAATVLLAILGGVCASLLRSIAQPPQGSPTNAPPIDMLDLERIADELVGDGGFRDRITAESATELSVQWPGEPDRSTIRVRRVKAESVEMPPIHVWVAFWCDGILVWRCIELSPEGSSP